MIGQFLLAGTCLLFFIPPAYAEDAPRKWQGHVEAEGKWGTERSLGELGFFAPLLQTNTALLFTDIRARIDDQESREGNFGIGLRHVMNGSWIAGGYVFYDRRRTPHDNTFNQATLGLEALTTRFDLRVNAYLPESGSQRIDNTGGAVGAVNGAQLQIQHFGQARERALPGFDAEIGAGFDIAPNWTAWAYGGGYYFDADDYEKVSGPRGRIEISRENLPYLGEESRFTIELEAQHDDVRDGQAFGIARLRVPFSTFSGNNNRPSLSPLEKRMTNRVYRDIDIVSGEQAPQLQGTEDASIALPGGGQTGTITIMNAADDIAIDIPNAGAGKFIVLDGSAGAINATGAIQIQPSQIIAGGGAVLTVTGNSSGKTASFVVPGSRPTINAANPGTSVFEMEADSVLTGVNTDGGFTGVGATNKPNLLIKDVSVNGTTSDGIALIGAGGGGSLENVRITNAGVIGLAVYDATYTATDITIDGTNGPGINMDNGANLTLNKATITNVNGGAPAVRTVNSSTLTMNNTTISNVAGDAVLAADSNLAGSGNVVSGAIGGVACNDAGGNTGAISFTDIQGGGAGTCP